MQCRITRSLTLSSSPPLPNEFFRFTYVPCFEQVAEALRDRWVEVAFSEFSNSSYVNIDHQAYLVWAKFNWWMVPWFDQVGEFHFDSTSGPSSDSTSSSSSSSSKGVGSSWTSSVSSTCDR